MTPSTTRTLPAQPPINIVRHADKSITLDKQSAINLGEYIKQLEAGYE